ncbi:hypothetical protein HKK55_02555 [Pseudomonas sp. ADAK18]|jgi:hypothetical protein|uniref:hypothetical protein n=1 Tax=Pseudomonas sp. ADAK18 TaxID=2730848 RepID=UPI00146477BA|nr:hypothetical protein [Pseudomonas sp. ADAK18]QJI27631.1 hypothetical protein HKK55_02555 [Pseudomonas sp. ADAK18]
MKLDPRISAELARLEPNQIGVMAWSLMAHPSVSDGGIPGQPDEDYPQPTEPGEPTLPDEPPPAPVA